MLSQPNPSIELTSNGLRRRPQLMSNVGRTNQQIDPIALEALC